MKDLKQSFLSKWIVRALMIAMLVATPRTQAEAPVTGEKTAKPTEAEIRLQSLRRSVESATDIKIILDRYARFIEQNKESSAGKDAERDVASWKDRLAKGMVKVGTRWVMPAEREALKGKSRATAIEARNLMIQERGPEADALVRRALEEDPANPGALYLNGVSLYNQNQKPAAKKCFEAVALAMPSDGPTLNNLAVIQWNVEQPAVAMKLYDRAMTASRVNKAILQNVAEAINVMPANQKTTIVASNAMRNYETQLTVLAKKMAQEGLHPWGARWVDQATLTRLEALEKEIHAKVTALSADYNKVSKQSVDINNDIEANKRTMQQMQNATTYRDAKGVTQNRPLSPQYYVLERRNDQLAANRLPLFQKMSELQSQATLAEREMPIQKYTMMQSLIGPEGMPVTTAGPATKPN